MAGPGNAKGWFQCCEHNETDVLPGIGRWFGSSCLAFAIRSALNVFAAVYNRRPSMEMFPTLCRADAGWCGQMFKGIIATAIAYAARFGLPGLCIPNLDALEGCEMGLIRFK